MPWIKSTRCCASRARTRRITKRRFDLGSSTLPSGMNLPFRKRHMNELNRSAIVVTPKQPFLDWLHSVDPTGSELTMQDLGLEPQVYLIRECETEEDFAACLQKVFPVIFADQVQG